MALSRAHRLSLRLHRDRLNRQGSSSFGRYFTVVSAPQEEQNLNTPRFAVLVSKKTAAQAVDRNRLKRLTSSLLETLLPSLPPRDYLVIPKRQVLTEKYSFLQKDLEKLFSQ